MQAVSTESAILAPYLIRFYLTMSSTTSSTLKSKIYDHLIGQIVWLTDALRRVTACFPKAEDEGDGISPEWLSRDDEDNKYHQYPTPVHPVDQFLSERNGPFYSALRPLCKTRREWMRNVLQI